MPLDIRASLDGAIRINGDLIAVFCFAQQGATREWTAEEAGRVSTFGETTSPRCARGRLGRAGKPLSLMEELDQA